MKKIFILAVTLFSVLLFNITVSADEIIPKTNISNANIFPYEGRDDTEYFIIYNDSSKEIIDEDYIGLFINGSIIKNANIIIEDNKCLLPIKLISENLDATVSWDAQTNKVMVHDGEKTIELFVDRVTAKINNSEIVLDTAPTVINARTYLSLSSITEILGVHVEYFDGKDDTKTHIVKRMPHVMISRYTNGVNELSEVEAIELLKEQLIIAFNLKFGEFIPLFQLEDSGNYDEKESLRYIISNLKVSSENDRYYVIPVVFDFWIDKYTGDVYVFYNGINMVIKSFNLYDENALSFAG
ncbi:Copper amine oxidase N-terminal domain-containing protein [Anaerovirgula multivorans]|uniref:Copper amine oxidase N-terminal domain-containing protein n=1 Tax=Anaerovirgula multivorans TaxID=312168 RepID=A0A239HFC6_9FIRM|nr:stalk domain-containing protein [Anaerovirgula multivorans]SNS80067.1 Copper amine oxidase N-terminal domain-containing protein [Anaerovirgula multivorans]